MSDIYILVKGEKSVYTYSQKLRDKYKAEGFKYIFKVHGWNTGVTIPKNEVNINGKM